ncbi:hypothetical protein ZIOFF_007312 [Zingiber officinale]|uniref:Response regulatory domain-containing protein n=1 Tax=Zingiber officinale TaxID=94328 RepID=A0A8J5M5P3_ZINOF|nr:hypothetical protein ZIOFF_007312 [Zingiber officinale]
MKLPCGVGEDTAKATRALKIQAKDDVTESCERIGWSTTSPCLSSFVHILKQLSGGDELMVVWLSWSGGTSERRWLINKTRDQKEVMKGLAWYPIQRLSEDLEAKSDGSFRIWFHCWMLTKKTREAEFHVLAVDDSLIDRKLIERLLRTSSYQVTTVDSGSKALELLGLGEEPGLSSPASPDKNEIEVNLIITDYCMPGMTGYDLLKRIKGSSSLKGIPVVIMSSENVPSRINRCLEGGAEEFFLKPIQLSDMTRLRPYMQKGKVKEQQQSQQQQQQLQEKNITSGSSNSNSNKRKAMEDGGIFPEKTRPRLSSSSLASV